MGMPINQNDWRRLGLTDDAVLLAGFDGIGRGPSFSVVAWSAQMFDRP